MNYLTAHFALAVRGQLKAGESVLVHGAAGGVGTATIQMAKAYGARAIAVVSTDEKAEIARLAGADDVVRLETYKDEVKALRSEEHTSELQSLMRISYAVFCLKKKTYIIRTHTRRENL